MRINDIKSIAIKDLFRDDDYLIPIYQRNYAWGEREVKQLIQDIYDSALNNGDRNYFIGNLIVHKRGINGRVMYETIDGQQRLTTLNILYAVLLQEFKYKLEQANMSVADYRLNLKYEARKRSSNSLQYITTSNVVANELIENTAIREAYNIIKNELRRIMNENTDKFDRFIKYLSEQVFILRIKVPEDTDLNHYFEIMNTRGEQLEKHEILKASLMRVFEEDKDDSYIFSRIWDACSDMERYVQYGFSTDERERLFVNDWSNLNPNFDWELLKEALIVRHDDNKVTNSNANEISMSINDILVSKASTGLSKNDEKRKSERFTSIINFQNFLLHILRVMMKEDISLDDKNLLQAFDKVMSNEEDKKRFVRDFGINLLSGKFLFDRYIIKREYINERDGWSLQQLKKYSDSVSYVGSFNKENINKRILMIQAMFHVSAPTLIYKHWLNGCLKFLFEQGKTNKKITSEEYLEWLENMAEAFLYDRYLAATKETKVEFYDIIFKYNAYSQNKELNKRLDWSVLNTGTSVENFIFNYLDYMLWVNESDGWNEFEFTFRSSVEHYYPQNPISVSDKLDQNILNHFGNLCLISRSKNSTLGRYMPQAKKDHYRGVKPDSLKQQLMIKEEIWDKQQIMQHGENMVEVIKEYRENKKILNIKINRT